MSVTANGAWYGAASGARPPPAWQRRLSHAATGVGSAPRAACAACAASSAAVASAASSAAQAAGQPLSALGEIHEMSVGELQQAMAAGSVTAAQAVAHFSARIRRLNGKLNAVVELNPDAGTIAVRRDADRAAGRPVGPLHGICVLLKENIDTHDQMHTTAGSLALLSSEPVQDAPLVAQLRRAGAVILGKTNLSEFANFRSQHSRSGWSARGGQTRNPHVLDRSPCGSSAGSAAAIAAGLATVAVGTETNGSIVCPAGVCGVVGLKPTVGVVPGAGIIPLSARQDTAGPIARSVADAAALLDALAKAAPAAATSRHHGGGGDGGDSSLAGRRIGVINPAEIGVSSPAGLAACRAAVAELARAGAILVEIPRLLQPPEEVVEETTAADQTAAFERGHGVSDVEFDLLLWEFKHDFEAYLQTRRPRDGGAEADVPRSLAALIEYNASHAEQELPHFGQDIFERAAALAARVTAVQHHALATATERRAIGTLHGTMDAYGVEVLLAPTGGPAWPIEPKDDFCGGLCSALAAVAGAPLISIPAGTTWRGLPLGLSFIGRRHSEETLLAVAAGLERRLPKAPAPQFLETVGPDVEG